MSDSIYMQRAIELAHGAMGTTSPNPPVGAVVVKDGHVLGEGRTQQPGQEHAEIEALGIAGEAAKGADIFVTLEPCAHYGRTPPCADAIIKAGVARVHIAVMDPAPHTDGRGVGRLRAAGVEVRIGEGHAEARHIVEAFAKHVTTGMPFVTVKFAMSLDGKIATASGMSRWISNETSRREAHRLRAESDAVMVGIGTVIADDPRLTVRDVPIKGHRLPLRVVVDSTGRLPVDAAMLSEPGDTVVAVADSSAAIGLRARSVEHLVVGAGDDRVDLTRLLAALGARGAMAVLVEGGGTLHGALLDQGIVDKVVIFVAPIIIGGEGAPGPVGGVGAASIADALRVEIVESRDMDGDIMLIGYPKK